MKMIKPTGLFVNPEEVPPKFYIQNFYPYIFLKKYSFGKYILDIGFGYGHGSFYLAQVADKVIAVDSDKENLENAQNKFNQHNLAYMLMDATNLNFPDATFDIVSSFQVIEHVKETLLLKYLSEISRVLKPEGFFCISTLNREVNMKPGHVYEKNFYHEKEFNLSELNGLLSKVFPSVEIYGLQLTPKHILFQRLKKIGLFKIFPKFVNPVLNFYKNVDFRDFKISKYNLNKSLDFICLCHKVKK